MGIGGVWAESEAISPGYLFPSDGIGADVSLYVVRVLEELEDETCEGCTTAFSVFLCAWIWCWISELEECLSAWCDWCDGDASVSKEHPFIAEETTTTRPSPTERLPICRSLSRFSASPFWARIVSFSKNIIYFVSVPDFSKNVSRIFSPAKTASRSRDDAFPPYCRLFFPLSNSFLHSLKLKLKDWSE